MPLSTFVSASRKHPGRFGPFACLAAALSLQGLARAADVRADVEARLKAAPKAHPRLFYDKAAEAPLRRKIEGDPLLAKALASVAAAADGMMDDAPVDRGRQVGRRLLGESRKCLERVLHLAFVHRMSGERRYLDRAKKELLAAAAFKDWNPSHFLDVAEMTAALAIGYDWLFDALGADARAAVKDAIVEKGLKPSLKVRGGWSTGTNNWNQVCHGGMTLGALALLEDEPDLAAQILLRALDGLPHAMAEYKPDGAYPEGPGYWGYGTTYNVVLIAALESVLGTDFGLASAEGFMRTPDYYVHVTGPTRLFFNYSDCGAGSGVSPAMAWFAARRKDPSLLWLETKHLEALVARPGRGGGRFFPLQLVWSAPAADVKPPAALAWSGRGTTPVACFRSGWDEQAAFVAVKAGSPSASHAHMDIGQFVMDADGVRWAEDLGAQDYHSLESQGIGLWDRKQTGDRWTVFRLNTKSHNTLVVDGQNQLVEGRAPMVKVATDGPMPRAVVDMAPVYKGRLAAALRGVGLRADRSVLVQDEIRAADAKASVRWGMVTRAEVKMDGAVATLTRDGKTLTLRVLEPAGAALKVYPTDPPPAKHDAPNTGMRMVGFETALEPGAAARLAVWLAPGSGGAPPALDPLVSW